MYLGPRQDDCPAGAQFYTCVDGFSGCCSVDACSLGGCSTDEVHQIIRRTVTLLGGEPAITPRAAMFSLPAPTTTTTSVVYYTPEPSATPDATPSNSPSKSKTGIIVGATIGGILFLTLAAVVAVFLRKRGGRKKHFGSRGTTPMLGNHGESDGEEKHEARDTPDSALRGSGGLFTPFGGYLQAPNTDEEPLNEPRASTPRTSTEVEVEVEDAGCLIAPVFKEEKRALIPPPNHPAHHALPGNQLPAYVPGQPAFNSLQSPRSFAPSFNHLPEQSPEIPGLVFTPIEIVLEGTELGPIPHVPEAELEASPVQQEEPPPSRVPSSKFSTARTPTSSPPLPQNSPRIPAPLAKGATTLSPPRENGPIPSFSMKQTSPVQLSRLSSTAPGIAELPASFPKPTVSDVAVKAPLNPTPAFHHIYLPEPESETPMSPETSEYSTIPIGLGFEDPNQKSRSPNLQQEQKRSPQPRQGGWPSPSPQLRQEKKRSPRLEQEQGSPLRGTRRSPQAAREQQFSLLPNQEESTLYSDISSLSDYRPALRDHLRQGSQDQLAPSSIQHTRSPSRQRQGSRSPKMLRSQPSEVSAMTDSYAREQPSDSSIAMGESEPLRPKQSKTWSAKEKDDATSWQVYKGDVPIPRDEWSSPPLFKPLFSPQGVSRRPVQLKDESDISIQPLASRARGSWDAAPLAPITPPRKTQTPKPEQGMF